MTSSTAAAPNLSRSGPGRLLTVFAGPEAAHPRRPGPLTFQTAEGVGYDYVERQRSNEVRLGRGDGLAVTKRTACRAHQYVDMRAKDYAYVALDHRPVVVA